MRKKDEKRVVEHVKKTIADTESRTSHIKELTNENTWCGKCLYFYVFCLAGEREQKDCSDDAKETGESKKECYRCSDSNNGYCRRYPPKCNSGLGEPGFSLTVRNTDWCGEFKNKE